MNANNLQVSHSVRFVHRLSYTSQEFLYEGIKVNALQPWCTKNLSFAQFSTRFLTFHFRQGPIFIGDTNPWGATIYQPCEIGNIFTQLRIAVPGRLTQHNIIAGCWRSNSVVWLIVTLAVFKACSFGWFLELVHWLVIRLAVWLVVRWRLLSSCYWSPGLVHRKRILVQLLAWYVVGSFVWVVTWLVVGITILLVVSLAT